MPNWCQNYLFIEGKPERLAEFDKQFKKPYTAYYGFESTCVKEYLDKCIQEGLEYKATELPDGNYRVSTITEIVNCVDEYTFSNFIPLTKEQYLDDWYEWSIKNWGTKWDLSSDDMCNNMDNMEGGNIGYSFETAWSPCIPVVEEMARQYPDLKFDFSYVEEGCGFAGYMVFIDGELEINEEIGDESNSLQFRTFLQDHNLDCYDYKCAECGCPLYEFECCEGGDECPQCGTRNSYIDKDIIILEEGE